MVSILDSKSLLGQIYITTYPRPMSGTEIAEKIGKRTDKVYQCLKRFQSHFHVKPEEMGGAFKKFYLSKSESLYKVLEEKLTSKGFTLTEQEKASLSDFLENEFREMLPYVRGPSDLGIMPCFFGAIAVIYHTKNIMESASEDSHDDLTNLLRNLWLSFSPHKTVSANLDLDEKLELFVNATFRAVQKMDYPLLDKLLSLDEGRPVSMIFSYVTKYMQEFAKNIKPFEPV